MHKLVMEEKPNKINAPEELQKEVGHTRRMSSSVDARGPKLSFEVKGGKPQKKGLTRNLLFTAVIIVLGSSYQFGYNIGVLNNPSSLIMNFMNDSYTERLTTNLQDKTVLILWSLTTASFVPGGAAGAFLGGAFADRTGRRIGILMSHVFVLFGALAGGICLMINSPEILMVSRLLFGINAGIGNFLAPIYLLEIAPSHLSGSMLAAHQLAITCGILMSSVLSMESLMGTPEGWPLLMPIEIIPAAISVIVLPFLPDTPRYLYIIKDDRDKAIQALQFFRQTEDVTQDIAVIDKEKEGELKKGGIEVCTVGQKYTLRRLFRDNNLRRPLFIGCFLQIIQQFSGINAIFFFSSSIYKSSGVAKAQVPIAVVATNAVNVGVSILIIPFLEKASRRKFLLISMLLMIGILMLITVSQVNQEHVPSFAYLSVACVIVYVSVFAIGLGPMPMLIGTELFRHGPRPIALATIGMVNWICIFVVGISFESIRVMLGAYTFLVFMVLMVNFTVFVYLEVPETKDKTFDEINIQLKLGAARKILGDDSKVLDDSEKTCTAMPPKGPPSSPTDATPDVEKTLVDTSQKPEVETGETSILVDPTKETHLTTVKRLHKKSKGHSDEGPEGRFHEEIHNFEKRKSTKHIHERRKSKVHKHAKRESHR